MIEKYKGYNIAATNAGGTFLFSHEFFHDDYDGPEDNRLGHAKSLQSAKDQIDELIEREEPNEY